MSKDEITTKYSIESTSRFVEESEKTKEWGIRLITQLTNFVNGEGLFWNDSRARATINYERFQGIANEEEVPHLVRPYGERLSAPYVRFPLGRSRIDQVVAEYTLQPPNRRAMCTDKESIDKRENEKIKMEVRKATAEQDAEIEKVMGKPIQGNQEVPLVDDVELFFEKGNYKEAFAEQVNDGIEYLYKVRNLQERIIPALKSTLISSRAIWLLKEERGDPMPMWMDPRKCSYELGTDSDYLDNCGWFMYEDWASLGQIINEFRDCPEFKGAEGKALIKKLESFAKSSGNLTDLKFPTGTTPDFWIKRSPEHGAVIKVVRLYFQSSKQIALKTSKRSDGTEIHVKVSPKARIRKKKGEKKTIKNVDDPWQIVCIGGCAYVDFKRVPNYSNDVDDPGRKPLPIVGVHVGKSDGHSTSMQDLLNPIDDMHDEVMFHIRMILGRAGGKSIIYDISQMPKQFGKDIRKLSHHMKNDGIIAVDMSKVTEEDMAMGRSGFNQWKEVDFSLSAELTPLMNFRLMLEQMADDITGLNDQRRGQGGQYETATNAQQAIIRSATRTEIYLYPFNQALKRMFEYLANMMKSTWKDGKKYAYWNASKQAFLKVMPDIALHNYGFYVGHSSEDKAIKENIQSLMQTLASSAPDDPDLLLSMVKVMKADYADEAERIFEKAIDIMKASAAQRAESEQKMAQEANAVKQEEIAKKDQQHKETLANNIDVANINVGGKLMVAETLTDQVEMKERAGILKEGMKSSENDQSSSGTDNTAEKKTKSTAKNSMAKNMARNQI